MTRRSINPRSAREAWVLAQSALANSPISALRELQIDPQEDRLLLQGKVHSFYHKQLAQETVRAVIGSVFLINGVQVE